MGWFSGSLPEPPQPKSVATITAGLNDTLAELDPHAEDQKSQAAFQRQMAEVARAYAAEHDSESELASKVAGNIRSLLT